MVNQLKPTVSSTTPPGFQTRLRAAIAKTGTNLCVGVDPHADALPAFCQQTLKAEGASVFLNKFSAILIDAATGVAPAIKFQSAFFEAFGAPGFATLQAMIAAAGKAGILTILDAKRGDIASTMAAYGRMAFEIMQADALTVTPYMGLDTVEPLLPWLRQGRGVYLVWVSSNAGGALVQDGELSAPLVGGQPERVSTRIFWAFSDYLRAQRAGEAFGLVAGATRVDALAPELAAELAQAALLMPGIGAQGGVISARLQSLAKDSGTVLVPQSRSLSDFTPELRTWDDYRDLVRSRVRAAASECALVR